MSDISQIDASLHPKRPPAERTPARDFAHELAKGGDGAGAQSAPRQDTAGAVPSLPAMPKPEVNLPQVAHVSAKLFDGTAAGIAIQEQLSVAVQPTGITQALLGSRVYGVHLLAGTYLSELEARAYPTLAAVPDMAVSTMAEIPPLMSVGQSDASPVSSDTASVAPLHEEAMAMLNLLAKDETVMAASHASPSSEVSIVSAEASTMLWPESSLRLTKQRDGSTVIWLRDFRMPAEGASHVVDALVRAARTEGIRLGKIVLNGREVWTSSENY
jgi:hypothetical protein